MDETKKVYTLYVYASIEDGNEAKRICNEDRKEKRQRAMMRDATTMGDEVVEGISRVVVMPSVPKHYADKLRETYPDLIVGEQPEVKDAVAVDQPQAAGASASPVEQVSVKKAVHRGGGRWYVMIGDEQISGPHPRDEAKTLAAK